MIDNLLNSVAGFFLALIVLVCAIYVHDYRLPEDLTVVWICDVMGNQECGPNQDPVMIAPDNLFRNW